MVRGNIIRFLSFSLIVFYGVAYAEISNLGDLDKLQSERFYYEAKAAANKAKREANEEIGSDLGHAGGGGTNATVSAFDAMPSLVKINGHKAIIAFSDGSTRAVSPGEMLPGGRYQVISISLNGVTVRRLTDGKNFPLN